MKLKAYKSKNVMVALIAILGFIGLSLMFSNSASAGANPNCVSPAYHVHVAQDGTLTGDPNNAIDVFITDNANPGVTPAGYNNFVTAFPNISGVEMCRGNGFDSDESAWTAIADGSDGLKHNAASGVGISGADFYAANTPSPTASPTPTQTVAPSPTASPTPTQTVAPSPTASPTPTLAVNTPTTPVAKPTATKSPAVSTVKGSNVFPKGAGTDLGQYNPASNSSQLPLVAGVVILLLIASGSYGYKRSRAKE